MTSDQLEQAKYLAKQLLELLNDGTVEIRRFIPPSLAEWQAYGDQQTPPFPPNESEKAWNHYEAKDWMIGKSKCRNWKAALRTCHNNWRPSAPKRMSQVDLMKHYG